MYIVSFQADGDEAGRITSCLDIPDDFHPEDYTYEGIYVDEQPDYANDYVDDGVIAKRPANTVTLEGNVLSGLKVGGKLRVMGSTGKVQTYDITTDTVTLNFPLPGTYKVTVEAWPMLAGRFEITI